MTEFRWPLRVYYEDTDSGGVVYHANYLKFMERARTEWLRSLGVEQDRLREQEGVIFAIRSAKLDFRRPARFNDRLVIGVRLTERSGARFIFEQTVCRPEPETEVLCSGTVEVVCLDAVNLRPRRVPPQILAEIPDEG